MTFSSSNRPTLTPTIYHYLDFILLKNKKAILLVSENEYIELIGAIAPILNDERILLVGKIKSQIFIYAIKKI